MANIKLDLTAAPFDGQIVTFSAPCGCDEVTDGLVIDGDTYVVCDAMGECVTGKGGAWCSGALVSVVLDVTNKKAYIQNRAIPEREATEDLTVSGAFVAETYAEFQDDVTVKGVLFAPNEEDIYIHTGFIANYAAPPIQFGTEDVTAGSASPYPEGTLYVVIE